MSVILEGRPSFMSMFRSGHVLREVQRPRCLASGTCCHLGSGRPVAMALWSFSPHVSFLLEAVNSLLFLDKDRVFSPRRKFKNQSFYCCQVGLALYLNFSVVLRFS